MKKIFKLTYLPLLIILLNFSANISLYSQEIVFERTDVEGIRADFVTATYIFGIDLRIENIENCGNIAFELRHNLTDYVKFDGYRFSEDWQNDFGKGITIAKEYVDSDGNEIGREHV